MEPSGRRRGYLREFLRSRSGVAGLVLLVALFATSAFVVATTSPSQVQRWQNPAAWEGNPQAAPPAWVNYFGVDAPQTVQLSLGRWSNLSSGAGGAFSASASFSWEHGVPASDLAVVPVFKGQVYEMDVTWTKPDGSSVVMSVSSPVSGSFYDATSSSFKQGIAQFIQAQTGAYVSSVTTPQEVAALFGQDGRDLLNSSVQRGTYTVAVEVLGARGLAPSSWEVSVVGDSYGTMGTDSSGRPIDLGVLAGLPWALEIGSLGSVVAVVGGVLWGGLSGFLGGAKDRAMSWGTLVILATPGLAFIVALSYNVRLTLLSEALIIAGLSWPVFAIIARTVSLSIKSQTYVEADRAMGVSQLRTFTTHFLTRLTPVTVAFTALSVSGFIITGETLAFLGIEPANVITWGGILNAAISFDASVHGWWWWVLFPGVMIIVASLPFVLVGFALDRVVAPRVSAR
ncbi:MAG: ABC transporter permease [Nitrososphaerota archaeon]|nr:ABC transporter permease [Nitrososphaerota archaeon]MDG6967260.1 ABC transporter permease [Nitrososphaerota archaeon]MDG6977905.1 ABC transporter permease [Nitrososphaerota archaeon]